MCELHGRVLIETAEGFRTIASRLCAGVTDQNTTRRVLGSPALTSRVSGGPWNRSADS